MLAWRPPTTEGADGGGGEVAGGLPVTGGRRGVCATRGFIKRVRVGHACKAGGRPLIALSHLELALVPLLNDSRCRPAGDWLNLRRCNYGRACRVLAARVARAGGGLSWVWPIR